MCGGVFMKIKIGFGAVVLPLALLMAGAKISSLLSLLSAVLFHELGHLITILILKKKIRAITLEPFGARIIVGDEISYVHEILIALAGPAASLLLFFILGDGNAADCSLFLGVINLLPVPTLDGGRVLDCAVSYFFGPQAGSRATRICGKIFAFLIWLISVYLVLRYDGGFGLFVFSCFLAVMTVKKIN